MLVCLLELVVFGLWLLMHGFLALKVMDLDLIFVWHIQLNHQVVILLLLSLLFLLGIFFSLFLFVWGNNRLEAKLIEVFLFLDRWSLHDNFLLSLLAS